MVGGLYNSVLDCIVVQAVDWLVADVIGGALVSVSSGGMWCLCGYIDGGAGVSIRFGCGGVGANRGGGARVQKSATK